MLKLPRFFHHFDKELHAVFYFCATCFLLLLYSKRWFIIPTSLFVFGVLIELAQDFSNKISVRIIGKRIHGRFDPEDIFFNLLGILIGLAAFSLLSVLFRAFNKMSSY
jgi:glycopeptide antibiotics resistance protein